MNNQQLLNSLPLQEASVRISNELILKKQTLKEARRKLLEDKKTYEADYIRAYQDGDLSENEPLKAATQNLKLVTGEIALNASVLQRMEGLEDVQFLIGTYDFGDMKQAMSQANDDVVDLIKGTLNVANINSVDKALQNMTPVDIDNLVYSVYEKVTATGNVERDIECLRALDDYLKVVSKPPYNTCGVIVPYTTVRLVMNGKDRMTYRIYPSGVSFIDIGVMAANSRVAKSILGKEPGSSITIRHDSNNTLLTYFIEDIY